MSLLGFNRPVILPGMQLRADNFSSERANANSSGGGHFGIFPSTLG